jgi:hypothetical protein
MAIVEIADVPGSVSIRIEVADVRGQDAREMQGTRRTGD